MSEQAEEESTTVRRLRRKLERANASLARLEDHRERTRLFVRTVIDDMQKAEESLRRKNQALETTTRQLEAERARAMTSSAAKSQFLANMSHELRTPLNAIIGYGELLLEEDYVPSVNHEVSAILRAGRHLLGLINDVLDISKIEAGQIELEWRPFDIGHTLRELVLTLRPLAKQRGLTLRTDIGPLPDYVLGDDTRLRQILLNLLSNALKFTRQGEVVLTAQHADGVARIEVSDTGIGMTADQLARVFDPFVQADASTTRRYGGTGLGLSICRQLVDHWGGTLHLTSAPGVGSTFGVTLPMKVGERPATTTPRR